MKQEKGALQSLGVMGPVGGIGLYLLNRWLGDAITAADIQAVADQVFLLGGTLLGIWGRLKASKKIAGLRR